MSLPIRRQFEVKNPYSSLNVFMFGTSICRLGFFLGDSYVTFWYLYPHLVFALVTGHNQFHSHLAEHNFSLHYGGLLLFPLVLSSASLLDLYVNLVSNKRNWSRPSYFTVCCFLPIYRT